MPVDVSGALRQALAKLESEKTRLDRQIAAVRQALRTTGGAANGGASARASTAGRRGRKRMSPAERKAVSARMKAFWAKRKRTAKKKAA